MLMFFSSVRVQQTPVGREVHTSEGRNKAGPGRGQVMRPVSHTFRVVLQQGHRMSAVSTPRVRKVSSGARTARQVALRPLSQTNVSSRWHEFALFTN